MMEPRGPCMELRCTCSQRPLLAFCGRDPKTGLPWVHVKVYKAKRLYAETVSIAGQVQIRCRDCRRWFTVRIVQDAAELVERKEVSKDF